VNVIGPLVDGIVKAPGGALPSSCHPLYPMDGELMLAYVEKVSDPASFDVFIQQWVG
jgi:hypothetical protein